MTASREVIRAWALSLAVMGGTATAQSPTDQPPTDPTTPATPTDPTTPTASMTSNVGSPGTGGPSQVHAAETVPTEIQRQQAGTAPSQTDFLARLLGIEDSPVKVYGWLQNSYTGNTNGTPRNDQNFSVFPNRLANRWQGNQYYLVIEKPARLDDSVNFGFRFDGFLGNDWEYSKSYGLFDRAFKPNSFAGVDLPQINAEVHLPVITELGLDLRGGRFYQPAGFESVMAVKRPLLSAPYLFSYTPFTFLGFQSTLHINPQLNLINSAINGSDRWFDTRYRFNYQGGFNWTSKTADTSWTAFVLAGPDQLPTFPPTNSPFLPLGVPQSPPALAGKVNRLYAHHPRTYFDTVATHKWTDKLTQASEVFFIIDTDVVQTSGNILREASWYGYANWFLYTFDTDQKYTGVWRAEIFKDTKGTATGVADTYCETTLGLVYKPKPWLWFRPEARYDWAATTKPFNDGTRGSQLTLAVDVIFQF
jgi:Putative beta-barrel porin-2, OmpL-like. bbp2